jgi:hypothetical protein
MQKMSYEAVVKAIPQICLEKCNGKKRVDLDNLRELLLT